MEGGSDQHELVYALYTCPMAIEDLGAWVGRQQWGHVNHQRVFNDVSVEVTAMMGGNSSSSSMTASPCHTHRESA